MTTPYKALFYPYAAVGYAVWGLNSLRKHFAATDASIDESSLKPAPIVQTPAFVFDQATNKWGPFTDAQPPHPAPVARLKIITFNVYKNNNSLVKYMSCYLERWRYHVQVLLPAQNPDVLCLNEVGDEYLEIILAQDWVRKDYAVSDFDGQQAFGGDRGNLVLVRKPLLLFAAFHRSQPGAPFRPGVIAVVGDQSHSIAVTSVHFYAFEAYRATRKQELHSLTLGLDQFVKSNDIGLSCVLGDFNFHAESETQNIPRGYTDAWLDLHNNVAGEDAYTYDSETNSMIRWVTPPENRRMRLDRIITKPTSSKAHFKPSKVEVFANQVIPTTLFNFVFPSDHFGLTSEFTLTEPK